MLLLCAFQSENKSALSHTQTRRPLPLPSKGMLTADLCDAPHSSLSPLTECSAESATLIRVPIARAPKRFSIHHLGKGLCQVAVQGTVDR